MTYSCAIFSRGAQTLEEAQEEKLEMVARKLALKEGDRVLDVGCGWGSFPLWAATRHGASVVGITLSPPQAEKARQRAEAAGVADRVEIRVMDYRDLAGERFDAIASIGMVEHVGAANIDVYARTLAGLLEPGGRLLNHGITRLRHTDAEAGALLGALRLPRRRAAAPLAGLLALERAGFVTRHVEDFGADYAETLRHWAQRLDENLDEAVRLAGPERVRVWRLYLRAARNGFESGFTSIYQARCTLGLSEPAESRRRRSSIAQSAPAPAQLVDAVAAGGDADDPDAGAVAGLDVARGVADGDAVAVGERRPPETSAAALERLLRSARCGRAESEP